MRLVYNIFCKFNDIEILRYFVASITEKNAILISGNFRLRLFLNTYYINNPISVFLSTIHS